MGGKKKWKKVNPRDTGFRFNHPLTGERDPDPDPDPAVEAAYRENLHRSQMEKIRVENSIGRVAVALYDHEYLHALLMAEYFGANDPDLFPDE